MKISESVNEMRKWIVLVLIGVLAYWGLSNLDFIFDIFVKMYSVFSPFILGVVLAYVLNIPMKKMEVFIKKFIPDKH